ncbi:MAG TPA: ComF family protein [Candidatus Saccharimonadales bacterium]|nr:ComF family protein [Candidatus Saccharimonadales bacterium]
MSVLEAAIGWLAPPQCVGCGQEGHALCINCATSEFLAFGERCWRCDKLSPLGKTCASCRRLGPPNFVWITTNYDGLVPRLIHQYKFAHQRAAARPIAKLMVETFKSFNSTSPPQYIVVPVPTATNRMRERGFGHTELLAKTIARSLRFEFSSSLARLGQSRQLGSKRPQRLNQLKASFLVKNPEKVRGRHILLIDDVTTTGGTVLAAAEALRQAGAQRIDALLLAKKL